MIRSLLDKIRFDISADRVGPDCPFTHWRLYFRPLMRRVCEKKFSKFSEGADFRAGAYAVTCSKISIGKNVVVRPGTMMFADPRDGLEGSINIESDVMLGSGVHIYVGNHRFDMPGVNLINQGHQPAKSVHLKEGCWLGANVIVLPGVTVGKNSVVGAGSVVTRDIPDRTLFAGNPAKFIENLL